MISHGIHLFKTPIPKTTLNQATFHIIFTPHDPPQSPRRSARVNYVTMALLRPIQSLVERLGILVVCVPSNELKVPNQFVRCLGKSNC